MKRLNPYEEKNWSPTGRMVYLDGKGGWADEYRVRLFADVAPGETVEFGDKIFTAPSDPGSYSLCEYVADATHLYYRWEVE